MRQFFVAATLVVAAMTAIMVVPEGGFAQQPGQVPLPGAGFKPPPPAPIKPYQPVAVTLPKDFTDQSFTAFRKQLGDIAQHKDRAALAKLVVAQGFFWMQEQDVADKKKTGIANLASDIDLDAKDGSGWELLAGYANEPTAEPLPDRPNIVCAPADPAFDTKAFEALINATGTQPPEWGYPTADGLEVRDAAKGSAPVIDKLGVTLVRVLPDSGGPDANQPPPFLHVVTPSGKAGFVPTEAMSSIGGDQICYTKEAGGWKIAGYFGGFSQ